MSSRLYRGISVFGGAGFPYKLQYSRHVLELFFLTAIFRFCVSVLFGASGFPASDPTAETRCV